jgi:hypothetical protein
MPSALRAIRAAPGRLAALFYRPVARRCRQFLFSCLDQHHKQNVDPVLEELHLRLDNLVREQDRLLALLERLQAGQPSERRQAG